MKYMMFVCTDSEPDTDRADWPDIEAWVEVSFSGVGWVPYFVHRMHEHREKRPELLGAMTSDPQEQIARGQCWFSFEAEEPLLATYNERGEVEFDNALLGAGEDPIAGPQRTLAASLLHAQPRLRRTLGKGVKVGHAGTLVTRVLYVKEGGGKRFVIFQVWDFVGEV